MEKGLVQDIDCFLNLTQKLSRVSALAHTHTHAAAFFFFEGIPATRRNPKSEGWGVSTTTLCTFALSVSVLVHCPHVFQVPDEGIRLTRLVLFCKSPEEDEEKGDLNTGE